MVKKAMIAIVASLVLALSAFLGISFASVGDTVLASDGEGVGTYESPFLIGTQSTLRSRLETHAGIQGMHFRLINNINLIGEWMPIPLFTINSVFDGGGFILDGLTVTGATAGVNRGMFANFQGTIRNLNFSNVSIQGGTDSGVVTGVIMGAVGTNTVLLENIRVLSGNVGMVSLPGLRTGGIIGENRASGTNTANRARLVLRNVSADMGQVRGGNSSGGLIGRDASTNMNTYILDSYFIGTVHNTSNIVGGLIGTQGSTGGNRRLLVENSFARGTFFADGTFAGGLVGWSGTPTEQITIRNSFAFASVSSRSGPNGGIFGGSDSAPVMQRVFIENSFFSTDLFLGNVTGASIPTGNVVNSYGMPTSQMRTQSFIDMLNANAGEEIFIMGRDGFPIQRAFVNPVVITFSAHGKEFHVWHGEEGEFITGVLTPSWIGHAFAGWNTEKDGSGVSYANLSDIPTQMNLEVFAQWTRTSFLFVSDSGNLRLLHEGNPIAQSSLTIFQRGYIEAQSLLGGAENFIGFMVLNDEGDWVNLGAGDQVIANIEYHLHLEDLVDEDFIEMFAIGGQITFRGVFEVDIPRMMTFTSFLGTSPSWGSIRVDGINRTFGSTMQFPNNHTDPITIQIIPNRFRTLTDVTYTISGIVQSPIAVTPSICETYYTVEINPGVPGYNMQIYIDFGTQEFEIVVESNVTVPEGAIIDTRVTEYIGLGDRLEGIYLHSLPGYRLTDPSWSNLRIFDTLEQTYEHFNAIDGEVNIEITEDFLTRFLQNDKVVITAIFVRQFSIQVMIENDNLGSVTLTARFADEDAFSTTNLYTVLYFDEGTTITLTPRANPGAVISRVDGYMGGEYATAGNIVTLDLVENREILFVFDSFVFTLSAWAIDTNGTALGTQQVAVTVISPAVLHMGSTVGSITAEIATEYVEVYSFQGWYAVVGGERRHMYMFGSNTITNLMIDPGFIDDFADGMDIYIVAMFAVTHTVVITTVGTIGSGTFTVTAVEFDGDQWAALGPPITIMPNTPTEFPSGTYLKLVAVAGDLFMLGGIDGITENDHWLDDHIVVVSIGIDGLRTLTVHFVPRPMEIGLNIQTQRGGDSVAVSDSADRVVTVAVGDIIMVTLNPQSGFQLGSWTLNGLTIAQMRSQFDNVRTSGNIVLIEVTPDWINFLDGDYLDISVTTVMNRAFMIGMLIAAVAIPALVLVIILVAMRNANRKRQHAAMLKRREQNAARMGNLGVIQNLKKEIAQQQGGGQ
ncbi:MAG: hypothetical protein FWE31_03530 [Firmicutes bacterium]|nr:hypothetical protein [Bacillota bacterium]